MKPWPVRIFEDFPFSVYIVAASESEEGLVWNCNMFYIVLNQNSFGANWLFEIKKFWPKFFRQHDASRYCFVRQFVSLFVKKNLCVRSFGYIVGVSPPCENMCVRLLGYIVGASPLVCVLSLEDNLPWILACCLLHFAAFLYYKCFWTQNIVEPKLFFESKWSSIQIFCWFKLFH